MRARVVTMMTVGTMNTQTEEYHTQESWTLLDIMMYFTHINFNFYAINIPIIIIYNHIIKCRL